MKTFEITLDIENDLYNPTTSIFSVSQNDIDSIELHFNIIQDRLPMNLTGTTIELAIKKPSGLSVFQDCEIVDAIKGQAVVQLSVQSYIEYGIHAAEIYVTAGSQIATTSAFYYMTREAIMDSDTIESSNDWSALQQALFAYDKKPIIVEGIPNLIPEYVGQTAFDVIGERVFFANGLTEVSWQMLGAGEGGGGIVSWLDILGKPNAFTPEIHTHDFVDIQGKPATYPAEAHNHEILDVTGLQAALDAKANTGDLGAPTEHTHAILEVTGLQAALDSKADDLDLAAFITEPDADLKYALKGEVGGGEVVQAAWGGITGALTNQTDLQAALDSKADSGDLLSKADAIHNHAIADVTGLQIALDGKADNADLTTKANVADLAAKADVADLAAKANVADLAAKANVADLTAKADVADLDAKANVADLALKANVADVYPKVETYTKTEVDAIASGITEGGGTVVQDNLISTSKTAALSANQGRVLNETKSEKTHNHDASYAAINHVHSIDDIQELQAELNQKASSEEMDTKAEALHTHEIEQVTGLQIALDGKADDADLTAKANVADLAAKADAVHAHPIYEVTGLQLALDGKADDADLAAKANTIHTHAFGDITGKPATYPAEVHNHAIAEVTGLQPALDAKANTVDLAFKADLIHTHSFANITGKPATYPAENHAHPIAEVTGLQAALDGKADDADLNAKANVAHTHTAANITDFGTAVAGAIPAAYLTQTEADALYEAAGNVSPHNHPIAEVTGLQTALDGKADDADLNAKANVVHSHAWGEITGKPATFTPAAHSHDFASITGKPATYPAEVHNHEIANVNGLQTALDGKADDADLNAKANVAHSHAWGEITGKPTTFTPAAHAHDWLEITGKPVIFPAEAHYHSFEEVVGLQAALDAKVDDSQMAGLALWKGTQAAYDAIGTPNTTTLYFISG